MYKICFYVPDSHLEAVKNLMFNTGAGKIGNYSHCCWQIRGEGQFMPLQGSNSYSGTIDQVEKCDEYKVEMVCRDDLIGAVLAAMRTAHPYEEPAYQVWRVEEI